MKPKLEPENYKGMIYMMCFHQDDYIYLIPRSKNKLHSVIKINRKTKETSYYMLTHNEYKELIANLKDNLNNIEEKE